MAGKTVAGDLYESVTGQLFEIGRQLRQPNGYPYDPIRLKKHLQDAIEGRFTGTTSPAFRYDKGLDGLELVENKARRISDSSQLELLSFLREGEEYISGEEMRKRAVEQWADLGVEDAEFLLDHLDLLPKPPRGVWSILFPGTLRRSSGGGLFIPSLLWSGSGWLPPAWAWVGGIWGSNGRFLHSHI